MKKLQALLKRVELFEKLAVYGDRQSFLKALAQQADITPEIAERLQSLHKDIAAIRPSATDVQNKLLDAARGGLDPEALRQVVVTARDMIPTTTNKTQWDRANELLAMLQGPEQTTQSEESPKAAPAGHAASKYNPRVHTVQSFINRQLVPAGVISPIDEDGVWGNETASALKTWGDRNKMSGVPLNSVFTAAEQQSKVFADNVTPGPELANSLRNG